MSEQKGDGSELETRVERLERLAGVEGVLPTTRRQYLSGLGGLAAGAIVGKSAVESATATSHGAGILGASDDRIAGIYVTKDFGPTMSVDAIDGGVAGLSRVDSLSGNSYFETDTSADPTSTDGDVVLYPNTSELYAEGAGEADWEQGYNTEIGSASKNTDHLYLEASGDQSVAEYTWVTTPTYNMSEYSIVEVEWENTGTSGDQNESHIVVSTDQGGDHEASVLASYSDSDPFGRTTVAVSLDGVNEDAHVRVHARGLQGSGTAELRTYNVRLM